MNTIIETAERFIPMIRLCGYRDSSLPCIRAIKLARMYVESPSDQLRQELERATDAALRESGAALGSAPYLGAWTHYLGYLTGKIALGSPLKMNHTTRLFWSVVKTIDQNKGRSLSDVVYLEETRG